jgi:uncharacterized protein YbjT (DUF2867 family)
MKVLATGATGKYGGLVVPELIRRGVEVRAVIHDPNKAAAVRDLGVQDTVALDLTESDSVEAAVKDVDGVFLLTPAFHPEATRMGLMMVAAATAAGVGKFVYNGVYHPSLKLPNHASTRPIEEALYASELDFTVLQPAMYVQALAETYRDALDTGAVVAPWSKHSKMSYVDYRDVAEVAAMAFTDPRLSFGTFELAAGGMVDRIELAALMSQAAGKTLQAADLPDDAELPPGQPEGLATMFDDYDKHGFRGGNPLVLQAILGRGPRSVADYIASLSAS